MERNTISITKLCQQLEISFNKMKDYRHKHIKYKLTYILMEVLKCFFHQYPSLRQYYKNRDYGYNRNNDNNLLATGCNISQSQLRTVIDKIDSRYLRRSFKKIFAQFQRTGRLKYYKVLDKYYVIAIDGVTYYSSNKMHCSGCVSRNGNYFHQALQPYLCAPDSEIIVPLMAEAIKNRDGHNKQDCELRASYRLLGQLQKDHPKLPIMIIADSLFSKQPFVELCHKYNFAYTIVAKPKDHKFLFELVNGARDLGEVEQFTKTSKDGIEEQYEYINQVDLNGRQDAVLVNYFAYSKYDKCGNKIFHCSWISSELITRFNVVKLVSIARARWKSENEGFNSMKNQGYHLEHNYGHGKNLSMNLYLLNVLAFGIHRLTEVASKLYNDCYRIWQSRAVIWQKLSDYFDIKLFHNWEEVWIMMIGCYWSMPP